MSPIATTAATLSSATGLLAAGAGAADPLTNVVTILNIGFAGLAFLLMYLAYRLIASNPSAPVSTIRFYIGAALFLAVLSCGSELTKVWIAGHPVRLWVSVSPAIFPEEVGPARLAMQAQQWDLKPPAAVSLTIVNDEALTLQLDALIQKIDQLQMVVNGYAKQAAKADADIGAGPDPFHH
jgi:hypothetical protein